MTTRTIGGLAALIVAGCQAEPGLPGDDPGARNADIEEALAALPDAEVLDRADDGVPRFVVGSLAELGAPVDVDTGAADRQLKAVLDTPLAAFRLRPDELVLVREHADDGGDRHFRYRQVRDGLDVVGSELLVHVDGNGTVTGINGTARGDVDPKLGERAISEQRALEIAASDPRLADLTVVAHRLVYVQPSNGGPIYLAYELVLTGDDDQHLRVFVDVDRATVAEVQDLNSHGKNRSVHDADHTTSGFNLPGTLRRSEHGSVSSDAEVNTVFDNLGITYDAFAQLLQRDSYDNSGGKITASVHYGTDWCNASFTTKWLLFPPGAFRRQLVFGDGDMGIGGQCAPFGRALDMVAHEFTHWVTYSEGDLNSSGEPNAIDESLSDIFGAVVEAWAAGGQTGPLRLQQKTWTVGEDLRPVPFRDMCAPKRRDHDDLWTPDVAGHGEHTAAGVGNLAFCLLARGGSHPRGETAANVTGIGMLDAAAIFYKAQRDYLVPNTNYAMLRTATEQATTALGFGEQELRAVRCAWAAVGVGTASQCGTTDIIWRTSAGAVAVWTMDGAGATGWLPGQAAGYQLVGTGDFSGDGRADILWRSMSTGGLAIWTMNGGARIGELYPTSPSLAWEAVAVGDFDGGGLADIMWRDPVSGAVAVWFMHGHVKIGETQPTTLEPSLARGPTWKVAAVGDFDRDGTSDVIWRNDDGMVSHWQMRGTTVPLASTYPIHKDWVIAGAGDFSDDGKSDILWRHLDGQVAIWHMNGFVRIGEAYPGKPGLDWQIRGVGDFNADGQADILWRNDGGANAIWLGGVASAAIYPTGAGTEWQIAATGQLD